MKKAISIIMVFCMALCLVSCKSTQEGGSNIGQSEAQVSTDTADKTISLLYSYSDSFNPYTAKTASNREIGLLLYDTLIKTDNSFEPIYVLARSVVIEGTVCTVKLNDAAFTDGSAVTSDDIVYSYNLAKECVRFSGNFYEVASVSTPDKKTVVFNLSQHDPYFINLLDFPIIKSGTAGITNDDGKEIAPIGCGRYTLSADGLSLALNQNYYGKKGVIKKINLINSPDEAATSHYVEVGATYAYYNDSGATVRMSGKKTEVNTNHLVYIGINSNYGSLAQKEMRYALSSALDREAICRTAYYNNAMAATGFFNPMFKPTSAVQTIEKQPNAKITIENLSKIGYNNMNSNGFYANSSGNNPTFTLLVNSENPSRLQAASLIVAQCRAAGIELRIVECDYAQYVERLTKGDFQLYLGEVAVLDNMDLTALVAPGGIAAYGVKASQEAQPPSESADAQSENPQEPTAQEDIKAPQEVILQKYHAGECGMGDIASILLTEMPQIPVCYLKGNLFYSSQIKGGMASSSSDIFLTIQNYEF